MPYAKRTETGRLWLSLICQTPFHLAFLCNFIYLFIYLGKRGFVFISSLFAIFKVLSVVISFPPGYGERLPHSVSGFIGGLHSILVRLSTSTFMLRNNERAPEK
ncbi:hypothetical protein F4804DRAFT_66943 [Jackrogersella minutella]|nr:hypothetical protein F4804DRAFT_66943 [Jackrogersella minutella]